MKGAARRPAAAIAVAIGLALLASATTAAGQAQCSGGWGVSDYLASTGGAKPVVTGAPPIQPCGSSTGYQTSEPTVAATGNGAILFSPADSENTLARSGDAGATWSLVGPHALQPTSLWNTVDPQVVLDRRTGRLFWAHTTYTVELGLPLPDQSPAAWLVPTAVANAHGFQVFSSGDGGRSWSTADYRNEFTADWEKLFVGPPPAAATGATQPRGYPDIVYLCANAPQEVIGPGRACYKSLDGGATFTSTGYVFPALGAPVGCPPLAANTGVVANNGEVFLPQSCLGGTYVATSNDEGASYTWLPVAGAPASNGLGAVVQLAIDPADNLYLLWVASDELRLVVSRDGGRSWSAPLVVSPPGLHNITLPALATGAAGAVGVAFYAGTSSGGSTPPLSAYLAQTSDALVAQPLFRAGAVNDPVHPIFSNLGDAYSPRADFIGAAFDSGGRLWGAFVRQLGPPDAANRIATTGYAGWLTTTTSTSRARAPRRRSATRPGAASHRPARR